MCTTQRNPDEDGRVEDDLRVAAAQFVELGSQPCGTRHIHVGGRQQAGCGDRDATFVRGIDYAAAALIVDQNLQAVLQRHAHTVA
ncbi:MAG: hypothetical protein ACRDK4_10405 [Solirubrobacteraceae bacterium]